MRDLYIIEARVDGKLDLTAPQPEDVFGMAAIRGIDEDAMAKRVFSKVPNAIMSGDSVSRWPSLIDQRWIARRKYW